MKSVEKLSIESSMREFTRTSVLAPAEFSFHEIDLNSLAVGLFDVQLMASRPNDRHTPAHIVVIQGAAISWSDSPTTPIVR